MRKFITISLFLSLILVALPMPISAVQIVSGDLIKTMNSSSVYYYGYDGQRHAFPNEGIYFSWYYNFDRVRTISQSEMADIKLGGNILVRPGTYLIKLISDPKVYAVDPKGRLRYIASAETASYLYGPDWGKRVMDMPDSFYGDYIIDENLNAGQHATGTVFYNPSEGNFYIITNGYKRQFFSLQSWDSYHYNNDFILSTYLASFQYEPGENIANFRVSLADTAQTLTDTEGFDLVYYTKEIDSPAYSAGDGLRGRYFNGQDFEQFKFDRIDSQINFDWMLDSPGHAVNKDFFSIRWTGRIKIDRSKTVKFYTYADDGVRLWIDDKKIISDWNIYPDWNNGSIYLEKGMHDIMMEYYDYDLWAHVQLFWNSKTELIPRSSLYSY